MFGWTLPPPVVGANVAGDCLTGEVHVLGTRSPMAYEPLLVLRRTNLLMHFSDGEAWSEQSSLKEDNNSAARWQIGEHESWVA